MPSADWMEVLSRYAKQAGFVPSELKSLPGAPTLTDGAALLLAPYAQLLAIPIADVTQERLRQVAMAGQEWLDVSCIVQEREQNQVVDAYLVLVSNAPMPQELSGLVREIELDATSCRKHVAWPCPGEDEDAVWRLLLRVTVLGLPPSPAASGMTNTPILSTDFEKAVLKDISDLKGRPAARHHAEAEQADLT